MIALLAKLLIAHLVGDFILFRNNRLKEKGKHLWRSKRLLLHSLVHFVLAWTAQFDVRYWFYAMVIGVSHYLGEIVIRILLPRRPQWAFVADQLFHILLIFGIAIAISNQSFSPSYVTEFRISWIRVAGLVAVTFPAGKFIEIFLSQWPPTKSAEKIRGLVNAGQWIGILERVLIFIFITTAHWEGIGFLLTAKSVFRFGDLSNAKDVSLTEYILVGTLMSFCLAIGAGLIVNYFTDAF